jgi:uncharacterized membrane protein (UPF0136 family)
LLASVQHDASAFAWVVVAAYFAGALAAFAAGSSARSRRERRFWFVMAGLLVLLGLNKQFDLQTFVTTFGRSLAQNGHWYEYRRAVQAAFVALVAFAAASGVAALVSWSRGTARAVKIAAAGSVLLFAFIVLRAASFHHIDEWVTMDVLGLRSGRWLELAGIAVIGCSAVAYRSRS